MSSFPRGELRYATLAWMVVFLVWLGMCGITAAESVADPPAVKLTGEGWNPRVRDRLEKLISLGAGKRLPVIFDFDNTLISRDIGEATFAVLVRDGVISRQSIPPTTSPTFLLNGKTVSLENCVDLTEYYDHFCYSTTHHKYPDDTPYIISYSWLVEIMEGLTPRQVVNAAREAYGNGTGEADRWHYPGEMKLVVTEGKTSYRRPFFQPEMVELVATFLEHDYDVWVISASNVWTVRWMVCTVLKEKLEGLGVKEGIPPEQVIGISTALIDGDHRLWKDPLLVRENRNYAEMDPSTLQQFRLTTRVDLPLSGYYGKLANIHKWIRGKPYLIAGDSPNDHPMMRFATHKLWMARLEKKDYQATTAAVIRVSNPDSWLIQPVLYKKSPGLVPMAEVLAERLHGNTEGVKGSIELLREHGLLKHF